MAVDLEHLFLISKRWEQAIQSFSSCEWMWTRSTRLLLLVWIPPVEPYGSLGTWIIWSVSPCISVSHYPFSSMSLGICPDWTLALAHVPCDFGDVCVVHTPWGHVGYHCSWSCKAPWLHLVTTKRVWMDDLWMINGSGDQETRGETWFAHHVLIMF